MKERSIILSAWEVRAILAGTKTRITRPMKPSRHLIEYCREKWGCEPTNEIIGTAAALNLHQGWPCGCLFGQPGDRLIGKETWYHARCERCDGDNPFVQCECLEPVEYRASYRSPVEGAKAPWKWSSAATMPRWASRITLEPYDIQALRVREMTEEMAREEGVMDGGCLSCGKNEPCECDNPRPSAIDSFAYEWQRRWPRYPWETEWAFSAKTRRT